MQRIEGLADLSAVVKRIRKLAGGDTAEHILRHDKSGYDISVLYARFRQQDPDVCRKYLVGRGIHAKLVDELIADGVVVHNRYQGRSFCCFAVRDRDGRLQCLDNHEIEGPGKFVLGTKSIFTRDWPLEGEVFICEGIIDYLSLKTLHAGLSGFTLLGNQLLFDQGLLDGCPRIVAAFDEDHGGSSALFDLMERYPDKEITAYDLKGHKDPNELLQTGKKRLTAEDKLRLYEAFQHSDNKAALARQWGIDRSYMYQIIKECRQQLLGSLEQRGPGRKPAGQPDSLRDAWQQIRQLQEDVKRLATERDTLQRRDELMRIRLKWAEIEAAELRGDPEDDSGPKKKIQVKKKRKKRRLKR